jgi:hypothetical protein
VRVCGFPSPALLQSELTLTLKVPLEVAQAYEMLLVQISWGFNEFGDDKLRLEVGSTGCTVERVLRRCPILRVRRCYPKKCCSSPVKLCAVDLQVSSAWRSYGELCTAYLRAL